MGDKGMTKKGSHLVLLLLGAAALCFGACSNNADTDNAGQSPDTPTANAGAAMGPPPGEADGMGPPPGGGMGGGMGDGMGPPPGGGAMGGPPTPAAPVKTPWFVYILSASFIFGLGALLLGKKH